MPLNTLRQLSDYLSGIRKLSQLGMHLGNVAAKFIYDS